MNCQSACINICRDSVLPPVASTSDLPDLCKINRIGLNEASAKVYDALYEGVDSFSGIVSVEVKVTDVAFDRVFNAVMSDCPSTYYVHPTYPFACRYRDDDERVDISINHIYRGEDLSTHRRILKREIKRVTDLCLGECATPLEKELYIHDHLANTVEYTHGTVVADLSEYSAVGALVDRKAVCMGIAKAACVLLNAVEVEAGCVSNGEHMWNVVRIDGKTYNLDVTWDLKHSTTCHDYFNLSDRRIITDHELWNGPECTSDDLDWFVLNGLDLHSPEELFKVVERCKEERRPNIDVRMLGFDPDDVSVFLEDAVNKFSIPSLRYSTNAEQSVYRLRFSF